MAHYFKLRPPLAPQLSENDIERQCVDVLRWRHWRVHRLHVGRFRSLDGNRMVTMGEPGEPDYVCIHAEHPAFYLETKRTKGKLTLVQEARHAEIERTYRIPTITVDRVEDLIAYLERMNGN